MRYCSRFRRIKGLPGEASYTGIIIPPRRTNNFINRLGVGGERVSFRNVDLRLFSKASGLFLELEKEED